MNKQESIRVSVRDLQIGDVTTGSKLTITHRPYTSTRSRGKVWVEATREDGTPVLHQWNPSTMVNVLR